MTTLRPLPIAALVALATLGACSAPPDGAMPADGVFDPYEDHNRRAHAFNRGLDKALVRPASKGYAALLPDEAETVVGNFARNFSQPSIMVNGLLQGDAETVGISFSRFFVNTIFGFGGLIDVATAFEFEEPDADFGETLHVWGVREGAYLELPILGPATERDAFGRLVDLFTNPLSYALDSPENAIGTVASVGSRLSDRNRFSDTVDSILYESADSYAQLRLIYLQNRRFELGADDPGTDIDPFDLDTGGF